jgi:signal transduction histidine kinase
MGLSDADTVLVGAFARKLAKAPDDETVVEEAFKTLKTMARSSEIRVVYSPAPSVWKEWKAGANHIAVRSHDTCPAPSKRALTVFFDPENEQSGFVSIDKNGRKARQVLSAMASQVWTGLLLQSALTKARKAFMSEAELVRETLRARDEERRHIARELHDDVGQALASLKLSLKWAEDIVRGKPEMSGAARELETARQDIGAILEKLRDLSHTLYPRILDTLGLVAAIKELAYQASRRSSLSIDFQTSGKPRVLSREAGVALYRCCQEIMSNAIRHSDAATLSIFIQFALKEIRVTVEDDGKGFDPRALYDSRSRMMSSGFWTIRQRMADLKGAFRVSTAEGHGTVVEMIVPYPRKVHARRKNKATHRR